MKKIDHDKLFKELLTKHFEAFIEGFFPEIHEELDFSDFGPENFLAQEQISELDGKLHRLDVIARVKIKSQKDNKACFVIFVEAQRTRNKEFLARVFRYFALLHLKFGVLIVPIVIYSDKVKWKNEEPWTEYNLEFAGHQFLKFKFLALKPSMLSIKKYLRSNNPAQIALASLMDLSGESMFDSKMELLRSLFKLKISAADSAKIATFIDSYLEEVGENFEKELNLLKEENPNEASMLVQYIQKQSAYETAGNFAKKEISWDIIQECTGISKPEYEKWLAEKQNS